MDLNKYYNKIIFSFRKCERLSQFRMLILFFPILHIIFYNWFAIYSLDILDIEKKNFSTLSWFVYIDRYSYIASFRGVSANFEHDCT